MNHLIGLLGQKYKLKHFYEFIFLQVFIILCNIYQQFYKKNGTY